MNYSLAPLITDRRDVELQSGGSDNKQEMLKERTQYQHFNTENSETNFMCRGVLILLENCRLDKTVKKRKILDANVSKV